MSIDISKPMKAKGVVHKMIADTAKGCAREHWEVLAKQNKFYQHNPDVEQFVLRFWPNYITTARSILTGMLGNPNVAQDKKDLIFDAIARDGAVNPKKMATPAPTQHFKIQ